MPMLTTDERGAELLEPEIDWDLEVEVFEFCEAEDRRLYEEAGSPVLEITARCGHRKRFAVFPPDLPIHRPEECNACILARVDREVTDPFAADADPFPDDE